ncbi:ty3-gypsy retrotransposon protein [Tanacetum coccineum]
MVMMMVVCYDDGEDGGGGSGVVKVARGREWELVGVDVVGKFFSTAGGATAAGGGEGSPEKMVERERIVLMDVLCNAGETHGLFFQILFLLKDKIGDDPERWIFSITEYFSLLNTPANQRLRIVGFNLEGVAAEWFWWMSRNGLITTWDRFVESVKNRFGPLKNEDPQRALSKLLQLGIVEDYQQEFQKLMNRVTDLEEEPAPTTGETYAPPAPKTAKQLAARRNQERVKSILLLAIPDEYLLKFHNVADAKSL